MMRHKLKTEEDVKNFLKAKLKKDVRDNIWQNLIHDRYVNEVLNGYDKDAKNLKKRYLYLEKTYPSAKPVKKGKRTKEKTVPPDERLKALSEILATEASRLKEVIAFRKKVLKDKLLKEEEIPDWILKHEGKPTLFIKCPFSYIKKLSKNASSKPSEILKDCPPDSSGPSIETLKYLVPGEKALNYPFATNNRLELKYPVPGEKAVYAVPINIESHLGYLKRVVRMLVKRYPWWNEAYATSFVLAGKVPPIPMAKITTTTYSDNPPQITLTLNPRLSSKEVAQLYAKARREVFKGKDKPITKKHLTLAVFLAKSDAPGKTWEEKKKEWNTKHPEWRYENYRWFSRDARAAFKRVVGRDFNPSFKKG